MKYRSSHVSTSAAHGPVLSRRHTPTSGLTPTLADAHPLHSEALLTKDHISVVTAWRVTPDSVGVHLFPAPIWEGFLCHLSNIQNTSLYISKLSSSSIHNALQEECGQQTAAGNSPLLCWEPRRPAAAGKDPNQVSPHRLPPARSGTVPTLESGMKGMILNRREGAGFMTLLTAHGIPQQGHMSQKPHRSKISIQGEAQRQDSKLS